MTIDIAQLRADLSRIISDLPESVTYDSVTYSARRGIVRRDDMQELEGLRQRYTFSVWLSQSLLHAIPEIDETVIVDGETHLILNTEIDPASVYIRLDLGEEFAT